MKIRHYYFQALSKSKKVLIISMEIMVGLIFSIVSIVSFNDLADFATNKNLVNLDNQFISWVNTIRTPLLTQTMFFFTHLGGAVILSLATLIISLLLLKKHRKETALFLISMIMGVVINSTLKTMFDRPRPQFNALAYESTYSFPSAHAMNNFIFYILLTYLTYHLSKNKKLTSLVGIFSISMVGIISFSRIYLGVHYFSDVIAGFVAGFWWIMTILSVAYTMVLFDLFMPKPTLKERIFMFITNLSTNILSFTKKH
ncbi:MAG: hypothetical protein COU63_00085 [Candidatus Pacebacteria bacterium CG10_big_fil_rev_8_21_14_0_10_36_11]|nr:phosphatase PAP2 family protein [Candidatus Pacearchaeota archaeon]OIP74160.1 MAG: hypothetical protein AUK08_02835 [Candidatus Pacebacteria bacterium CG2_30_36_39]PIR65064.1 MAG: hypothetical protein COU63_00085 [Candidatus Pacebacteria bacterium CG10_big_fil_rev_8_21_14_0_10_36_11]PJC43234.1 MAG: hypothetical protein CO040_00270 [Candidatus Pacebacteria bacterium CG_4_9_14_0_2_um_filter_36_8]